MDKSMARHIIYLIQHTAQCSCTDAWATLDEIKRIAEVNLNIDEVKEQ